MEIQALYHLQLNQRKWTASNPIQNEGQRKLEFKAKEMAFLTHYFDNWAGPIRIRSHRIVCKQSNRHSGGGPATFHRGPAVIPAMSDGGPAISGGGPGNNQRVGDPVATKYIANDISFNPKSNRELLPYMQRKAYILTGIKRSQQRSKFATTSFIKAANCLLLYALSIDCLDFDATCTALAGAPRANGEGMGGRYTQRPRDQHL
ncbi:hypothetical protein WN944_007979 [Citrus x changshan-huyou]|uniref:Uncharacterized protein n=1 Tax=Citrus x changshan-huyou TaxID=2935761 RepID=A0AAP0QYH6_9ROSI